MSTISDLSSLGSFQYDTIDSGYSGHLTAGNTCRGHEFDPVRAKELRGRIKKLAGQTNLTIDGGTDDDNHHAIEERQRLIDSMALSGGQMGGQIGAGMKPSHYGDRASAHPFGAVRYTDSGAYYVGWNPYRKKPKLEWFPAYGKYVNLRTLSNVSPRAYRLIPRSQWGYCIPPFCCNRNQRYSYAKKIIPNVSATTQTTQTSTTAAQTNPASTTTKPNPASTTTQPNPASDFKADLQLAYNTTSEKDLQPLIQKYMNDECKEKNLNYFLLSGVYNENDELVINKDTCKEIVTGLEELYTYINEGKISETCYFGILSELKAKLSKQTINECQEAVTAIQEKIQQMLEKR